MKTIIFSSLLGLSLLAGFAKGFYESGTDFTSAIGSFALTITTAMRIPAIRWQSLI